MPKKCKNGLVWNEWRNGDGVLCIELTGEGFLTDSEVSELHAEFLNESSFEILVQDDCNIYLPPEDSVFDLFSEPESPEEELNSRLFLVFRKGVLKDHTEEAFEGLRKATMVSFQSKNRGVAGGKVDPTRFGREVERVIPIGDGTRARYVTKDGVVSKTVEANVTQSSIVGFYPATTRAPYVRKTRYARDYAPLFERSFPYFKLSSEIFERECPAKARTQRKFLEKNALIEREWVLPETLYTTITVNKNFQTACHRDTGDLKAGMENFGVLVSGEHNYKGGYTVFPQFRVAFDCRHGDWVAMDVAQHYHGNTPIEPVVEGEVDYFRMSLVMYVREDLSGAGTQAEEHKKYLSWKKDFIPPIKKSEIRLEAHKKNEAEAEFLFDEFSE